MGFKIVSLKSILDEYSKKFQEKVHKKPIHQSDILLDYFKITPEQINQNKQYWNRELGMCWQKMVVKLLEEHKDYSPPIRIDRKEPCDLIVGKDAIDTKYRIGSGDSGTIKKLKEYSALLSNMGYRPVMLILREDNLESTIKSCSNAGWTILTGKDSMNYIGHYISNSVNASAANAPMENSDHRELEDMSTMRDRT